jgi:glycogen debranching enzyme
MAEKIQIGDKWYVLATSAISDEAPMTLKHDETFALFDRFGNMHSLEGSEQGLYHEDTRYLSHKELLIDGACPLYLGATVKEHNSLLIIELMNPDLSRGGEVHIGKSTLHIFRASLLWQGACYEHIRLTNHGREPVSVRVSLAFDADYADLFEVRGMQRETRGERLPTQRSRSELVFGYRGRDARVRRTRLRFEPAPATLDERQADFQVNLSAKAEQHLYCTVLCEREGDIHDDVAPNYDVALRRASGLRSEALKSRCVIETSNPLVNLWLDRSVSDLAMLTTSLPTGPYPYAGVPWYSTTFGRDGILTARQYLWVDADMARGVLAFLAATQATEIDPARDAEPGKILHEARKGEMARTGEIPFGRYYGTVDATPLFVALAGAYYQRTGDLDFVHSIWPQVRLALDWIDQYGDADGDGFVEYARHSEEGLLQQGWKDSQDSVFHSDGRLADAPIALCEVQGYVYEAKQMGAMLAALFGDAALARRLTQDAQTLKDRFARAFWCEEIDSYALALDGDKRQCQVPTSNAGHALWSGIATPEHARRVVARMLDDASFSGWGVRTVACDGARYNPMSYHNGSIWPHDNALIAAGMAHYGFTNEAMRVLTGLFDASLYFDQHRLPELFCGFPRRPSENPTLYPVACSPQAWAAAAVFGMLQGCLGLALDAEKGEIAFRSPRLPPFIDWMNIRNLSVQGGSADLLLQRYENNVGIEVTRKQGDLDIVVAI